MFFVAAFFSWLPTVWWYDTHDYPINRLLLAAQQYHRSRDNKENKAQSMLMEKHDVAKVVFPSYFLRKHSAEDALVPPLLVREKREEMGGGGGYATSTTFFRQPQHSPCHC